MVTSQQETATQGVDYAPISTSVTFTGSSQSIGVTIYDDTRDESGESFTLTLTGTGITQATTRITIVDNDDTPADQGVYNFV